MIEFKSKKPRLAISFNNPKQIEITFVANINEAPEFENLKDDKELTIQVKEYVKKRSISQNAYMWVLLDKIAQKIGHTKEQVYKVYIKDYGVFEILPIKNEAVDGFITKWKKNGLGWIAENIGDSKLDGYTKIIAYFGSSTYNTKEMSRLLEAIIRDCNEMNINTLSLEEILLLENLND